MNHRFKHAFSLVELSIVLVILGLLAGGVLSGQSLIRAAELRSIPTDLSRIQSATMSFRDKYMALPGDMPNAVRFWSAQAGGSADGRDATCAGLGSGSPATGKATCNGNGDGRICTADGKCATDATGDNYERFRFWQHLANAGLIEGSYTGVPGSSAITLHVPGLNSPASKLSNVAFSVFGTGYLAGSDNAFVGNYGNCLEMRNDKNNTEGNKYAFLKPEEMWNVDVKLDDGKPGFGLIRPYAPGNGTTTGDQRKCTSSKDPAVSEYLLQEPSIACSVSYVLTE
jgi:prepilin-type N-terminal cleavage/methylation domain-containing protein